MYRCILCQMIEGTVQCNKIYEDEDLFAYLDWNPWAPIHIVLYPKTHIGTQDKDNTDFIRLRQKMLDAVPKVADLAGCAEGYELHTEEEEDHVAQNEAHLHIHILGQKRLNEGE